MFLQNFYMISPLEQFQILPAFRFFGLPGWSNFSLSVLLTFISLAFIFYAFSITFPFQKNMYYWGIILYIKAFNGLLDGETARKDSGARLFFIGIATFIVASNVVGLLPWGFTTTSALASTLFVSLFVQVYLKASHVWSNGLTHGSMLLPSGTPDFILPFMILIELVSFAARFISLGVRLFANIMAGHTLLHILVSVIVAFFSFHVNNWIFLFLPWAVVFLISILETVIALMQGYVFIVLSVLYSGDIEGH
jgi:ATP synthase subunit 6